MIRAGAPLTIKQSLIKGAFSPYPVGVREAAGGGRRGSSIRSVAAVIFTGGGAVRISSHGWELCSLWGGILRSTPVSVSPCTVVVTVNPPVRVTP